MTLRNPTGQPKARTAKSEGNTNWSLSRAHAFITLPENCLDSARGRFSSNYVFHVFQSFVHGGSWGPIFHKRPCLQHSAHWLLKWHCTGSVWHLRVFFMHLRGACVCSLYRRDVSHCGILGTCHVVYSFCTLTQCCGHLAESLLKWNV